MPEKFLEILQKYQILLVDLQILLNQIILKQKSSNNKARKIFGNYIHYGVREHAMCGL